MFIFLVFVFLYFLPITISVVRNCEHGVAIFILTMATAWTGIGWVIALGWALYGKEQDAYYRR
jgi:ABC-type Na+ efflux pump permease subunit